MVAKEEATPLWITPLVQCSRDKPDVGRYETLQRLVTESPARRKPQQEHAEIETLLQVFIGPDSEIPLWKRVVVRSGPLCPRPVVHASFQLPEGEDDWVGPSGNVLCWTAFPEQPHHLYLCVLASPTLLCIWDVYPDDQSSDVSSSAVSEGHFIALPFEASSIHPLEGGGNSSLAGLLIQRSETSEDFDQWDLTTHRMEGQGMDDDYDDDDGGIDMDDNDGFVLGPPRPVRTSMEPLPPPVGVPSLFSLSHPLDDVVPISHMGKDATMTTTTRRRTTIQNPSPPHPPGRMMTDVFEKVLFSGSFTAVDPNVLYLDRKQCHYPICVTYHLQKKRHAIWAIQPAPPPPPRAPLWQVSSHWRSENGWNSHLGLLQQQQDLEDLELLGEPTGAASPGTGNGSSTVVDGIMVDGFYSHYNHHHHPYPEGDVTGVAVATRNDALADALGIRKTPRKAGDESAPRPARSARSAPKSQPRPKGSNNNNNISLLSPSARHPDSTTHDFGHVTNMEVDTSLHTMGGRPPLLTMGPFASLDPKVSIRCLYEDSRMTTEASRVFIASNVQGSGRLTLCLVCPAPDGSQHPNVLRIFPFEDCQDDDNHDHHVGQGLGEKYLMGSEVTVPCVAAVPIEASPVAPIFRPHTRHMTRDWNESVLDILLLQWDEQGGDQPFLSLYRGSLPVVECAFQGFDHRGRNGPPQQGTVCDLENSVGGHVDIVTRHAQEEERTFRANVSLRMTSGALNESILGALESSVLAMEDLAVPDRADLALKIRSDCVRLERQLSSDSHDGFGADSIGAVVSALFRLELHGIDVNDEKEDDATSASTGAAASAWEKLLGTRFHNAYEMDPPDGIFKTTLHQPGTANTFSMTTLSSIFSHAVSSLRTGHFSVSTELFRSLHFLYEDLKLNSTSRDVGLPVLGTILARLCEETGLATNAFRSHYKADLGNAWDHNLKLSAITSPRSLDMGKPFSVLSWFDSLISGNLSREDRDLDPSSINDACTRLRAFVRIYQTLYQRRHSQDESTIARDLSVVRVLIEEGITSQAILRDSLSPGTVLPLLEALNRCRLDHHHYDLRAEDPIIWTLIGREDLRRNADIENGLEQGANRTQNDQLKDLTDKDQDGLSMLQHTSAMLFPDDNRMKEVGRLLRSSRPVCLDVPRAIEVSDHDYERLKQEQLMLLSRRILALPLGRGMVTIGNLQPIPAEPLPLPDLCLVGRVPPTHATLALDTTECASDMKMWPEFSNGVAAGLRLPLETDSGELVSKITRTWIVYNRPRNNPSQNQNQPNSPSSPPDLGHSHGGLLMALGLRGHLTRLEMTDIFDYLTQGSVTTTVGVLLGMAANMRGTCDISVSKMLCLHIPSLIPQHFSAIDVSSAVQAAAVSGAGLLYQGSSHRMMTEFLLNEIGKRPSNDVNVIDREAYTLSCGVALGMVNLAQGEGNGNAGLADLRIAERLHRYIVGGVDDAEMRRKREEGDRLSLPTTSASNGNEKCSCVYEGDSINTDVTSPAATLALGLIYMKSGNSSIASALALPDTHFLLEYVRPDFLMLRIIARSLILWDDVEPSGSWIENQLPSAVRDAYAQMRVQAEYMTRKTETSPSMTNKEFDRQAVRLMYVHVIAGACFSIGLRFAGTGSCEASEAIYERVSEFLDLRDGVDTVSSSLRPQTPVLEMCLGCAALSLSMVMAGTGDLHVLRLLKVLRWRCDEEIQYGSHMALSAALGLLFLGAGTSTLGREPQDIAALLIAFYPRFPSSTSDNQYHLQALRNLYALATKRRDIKVMDVDTRETVFVPIEIRYKGDSIPPLKVTSPCLLSNSSADPVEILVSSDRYYPVALKLRRDVEGHIFYVKRRSGHLNYKQDPDSKRSLLVQTGSFQGRDPLNLVKSFTDDQRILTFAKHFCGIAASGVSNSSAASCPFTEEGFRRRLLFESLMRDTQEALPLYLALCNAIQCAACGRCTEGFVSWDFRLIKSYYANRQLLTDDSTPRIINTEIMAHLFEMLESKFQNMSSLTFQHHQLQDNGPLSVLYEYPVYPPVTATGDTMDLS